MGVSCYFSLPSLRGAREASPSPGSSPSPPLYPLPGSSLPPHLLAQPLLSLPLGVNAVPKLEQQVQFCFPCTRYCSQPLLPTVPAETRAWRSNPEHLGSRLGSAQLCPLTTRWGSHFPSEPPGGRARAAGPQAPQWPGPFLGSSRTHSPLKPSLSNWLSCPWVSPPGL